MLLVAWSACLSALILPAARVDVINVSEWLRESCVWLFVFGIVAGLWVYADARRVIAGGVRSLPPAINPQTGQPYFAPPPAKTWMDRALSSTDHGEAE